MFYINGSRCNGCGSCVEVCPQQAITIHDDLAEVNQGLCVQCGDCVQACPAGAIYETLPAHAKTVKGGEAMPYGYGRGFGFVGNAPSWPYVGRGRGGLPRCWHPGLRSGEALYCVAPTREGELGFLKSQIEDIEHRIQELEKTD